MALSSHMLMALHALAKGGERVASMGYPDVLCATKELEKILGAKIYSLAYREDSEQIAKWHGKTDKIPDAASLFKLMGMTLDVYDVAEHRGGEIIRDLNYPLPESDLERYEVVLDVGSLEHCFNIGQAVFNVAGMVKEGGLIFHENPFNWGNHGFYGLNPTWYHDFYKANGFELVELVMTDRRTVKDIRQTGRFSVVEDVVMNVTARRLTVQPFVFPVQHKYQKMIKPREAVGA